MQKGEYKGEAVSGSFPLGRQDKVNSLPSLGKGGPGWNGVIYRTKNSPYIDLESSNIDFAPFSPNPSFPEGRRGKREPQKNRKLNSHLNFQTWENDRGMAVNFFSKGERSEADHHSFFSFGKEDWSGMGEPATLSASGLNLLATLPHSPLISLEGEARLFKFIHTRMEGPEQNGKYHFPGEKELGQHDKSSLPSLGKGGLGWNGVINWR